MNGVRGETAISIGGREISLCLTLGALAEIETAFGCTSLAELQARLRTLSGGELQTVLAILIGAAGLGADEARELSARAPAGLAAGAVADAFHAALG
ncbi:MAG: GTA-gp10 family protein [Henriciella sp.]|uniref:GTA-gp10 family protein n=1 Tax=Henriciella sp. TaxID=1968823 RepID=UPI003C74B57C